MSKPSARNRFQTISAIQSADWMIDPFWAIAHMDFITSIEKNEVTKLLIDETLSREELRPIAYALDNFSFASPGELSDAKAGSIMYMSISGPMLRYGDWCSYGTEDFINWLEEAKSNPNIEGVFIEADTPGGESTAIPYLHELVLNFPKPTITWINRNMLASAGVYGFIGSDRVYASHVTDEVGSIGVYTRLRDVRAALELRGIKEISIYAPQSSEKNGEIRQLFDEGKVDLIEANLAFLAENFIEAVKNARGDKLKVVEGIEWEKGRLLYANQAIEIGLIDGIKSKEDAIAELVNLINQNKTIFSMFGDKHTSLSALRGVEATAITEDQLNQVNANLDKLDVKGVRVVNANWIKEAEDNTSALIVAQTAIKKAEQERDEWKKKAEEYGEQAGEKPTVIQSKKEGEEIKGEGTYISETDKQLRAIKGLK